MKSMRSSSFSKFNRNDDTESEVIILDTIEARGGTAEVVCRRKREKPPFICEICLRNFRSNFHLVEHRRVIHTGERPFVCRYCGYASARKRNLVEHLRVHGEGRRLFTCEICGKEYSSLNKLRSHQNQEHSSDLIFKCPMCQFVSAHRKGLKLHGVRSHPHIKFFYCDLCSLATESSDVLDSHKMDHLVDEQLDMSLSSFIEVRLDLPPLESGEKISSKNQQHEQPGHFQPPVEQCQKTKVIETDCNLVAKPLSAAPAVSVIKFGQRSMDLSLRTKDQNLDSVRISFNGNPGGNVRGSSESVSGEKNSKLINCPFCNFSTMDQKSFASHFNSHSLIVGST